MLQVEEQIETSVVVLELQPSTYCRITRVEEVLERIVTLPDSWCIREEGSTATVDFSQASEAVQMDAGGPGGADDSRLAGGGLSATAAAADRGRFGRSARPGGVIGTVAPRRGRDRAPVPGGGEVYLTEATVRRAEQDPGRGFACQPLRAGEGGSGEGRTPLYRAGRTAGELEHRPLVDEHYHRRADACGRFALLWLLLDQLPCGQPGAVGGGLDAREVWREVPAIPENPLIEDEGGFETTVLNRACWPDSSGRRGSSAGSGSGPSTTTWPSGMDPGVRDTGPVAGGLRHRPAPTSHAGRLAARDGPWRDHAAGTAIPEDGDRKCRRAPRRARPRTNGEGLLRRPKPPPTLPVLWHVHSLIRSPAWKDYFLPEVVVRMQKTWEEVGPRLLEVALTLEYTPGHGSPEHLVGDRFLFPMTFPYAGFVRMESYSLLSVAFSCSWIWDGRMSGIGFVKGSIISSETISSGMGMQKHAIRGTSSGRNTAGLGLISRTVR